MDKIRSLGGTHAFHMGIALLLTLGAIAGYIFIFYFIQSASITVGAAEEKAQIERIRNEKIDASKRILQVRSGDLAKLDNYIVSRATVASLIEHLEALGRHAGVSITIKQAQAASDGLELSFTTDGTFSNSYYFLTLLENLPLNITFSSASFDSALGTEGTTGRWHTTYSVRVTSFMSNEPIH